MEIRLCRKEEESESWALERMAWNPMNWEAEGSVGTDYFPELHLLAVEDGRILGTIDGCPMSWDGRSESLPPRGWQEMVARADRLRRESPGIEPADFWVGAIGTSVHPEAAGRGLSSELLRALGEQTRQRGFRGLVAPVRPVFRSRMPGLPIEEYAEVRLPDGGHFDPWVRTHERLGARIIATCPVSASFRGSREEWQRWSGMKLPDDGEIAIPEAIAPLRMRGGEGSVDEPSIWLEHHRSESRTGSADGETG